MKRVFLVSLLVLIAASIALYRSLPDRRSAVPVLTWVTDDDAVRRHTIALFEKWLADNHYPPARVRIDLRDDTPPPAPSKALIQDISGVGDDMADVYEGQFEMFQKAGVLRDVTAAAQQGGFGPQTTYAAARSDFTYLGRQYGYPRNVDASMVWINRATFARHGIPEPPERWDWDQFEELGKRFVAAANPPGTRRRVFFLNRVWLPLLRRGLGLSTFNETMTRCVLDDPRNAEVLRRLYRWTVPERLLPTQAEQYALAADASGYDSSFSLFASGRFAMIYEGLWTLIRLRPRGDFSLRVVEPFTGGFPNTEFGAGCVTVYAASKHPDLACRFLQFLASEPFNLYIAQSGDSMPPVAAYAATPAFLHPGGRPGERGIQAAFARAARDIGIAASKSPFILPYDVNLLDQEESEAVLAGRLSPEAAGRDEADRVNAQIARNLEQDPSLRGLYAARLEVQRRIDERRRAGRTVPAGWISDPFAIAYYRAHGWLENPALPRRATLAQKEAGP